MSLFFFLKDIKHKVLVKLVPSWLPTAKKKYHAKAALQTELDIKAVAAKADLYNIGVSAKVIEDGFTAASKMILYLIADNYKFKSPLFSASIRIPGEYDGSETHLPQGVHPEIRLTVGSEARKYVADNVQVIFDGVEEAHGFIGEVCDEATGAIDSGITPDNIVAVHGYGLKVESDEAHADAVGVFLVNEAHEEIPVKAIALNEPRLLKILTPANLTSGERYVLLIRTQSPVKGGGTPLKDIREVLSQFTLEAL